MSFSSDFVMTDGHTVAGPNGVVVQLPGPFALVYREKERSVRFQIDHTFALDTVLTYLIYAPERLVWSETGVPLSEKEFKTLRRNVVDALKLFNGIGLFIAPKEKGGSERKSSDEAPHVH
jgi:hypothetical protein